MTQAEWKAMAEERLEDANALITAKRWSAAYYLLGYAVECALKACIVRRIGADPGLVFEKRVFKAGIWTHNPEELATIADLKSSLEVRILGSADFAARWLRVCRWTEESRYRVHSEQDARELLDAVNDANYGVLQWVLQHC